MSKQRPPAEDLSGLTLDQLREKVERTRLERQLAAERSVKKLTEATIWTYTGSNWGDWVDPRDAWRDAYDSGIPALIQSAYDRQRGTDYIAFRTELELKEIRYFGRWLAEANVFGLGPLNALTNKVIGRGFTSRAVARRGHEPSKQLLASCQDELDRFDDVNLWNEWEREIFRISRHDGERFMRKFFDGPVLKVRSVENEQVLQPANEVWDHIWSFGVHCDPDDAQTVLGYFVSYNGDAAHGEEVPACEIEHFKINVPRLTRRGLSDFFAIAELADDLRKLMRNLNRGAALLAAIAWIEQFDTANQDGVQAFADNVREFERTDPRTGNTVDYERIEPGTIIRTGKGKTYTPPPLASANTPQLVEIGRQCRLAIATRWNAPEVIFGDASNGNYSSLAIAESPFVSTAEVEQQFYGSRFRRIKLAALQHAIDRGRLPCDALQQVDVAMEPPPLIVRDRLKEAQERHLELQDGAISPQIWCQELGYDFEEVLADIKRAKEAGWEPPPAPGGASVPGGGTGGMLGEGIRGPFASWRRLTG